MALHWHCEYKALCSCLSVALASLTESPTQ